MNWDQILGRWTEFKGKLIECFGELTDDEIEQARGDREQLEGIIQKKYGDSKEDVREIVDRLMKDM
ncbi:CsbD family protein [Ruegeria sp. B32]|uniref:CsbD family protein n=1 Tax=Ruegeria sp. B32 TaxID=2867020 RepID=UPI0021A593A0|nr:CsbD family protein [Ruegeria sp. B32]UWR07630.1 CsbD family protein [Ruegeria sp. B32]